MSNSFDNFEEFKDWVYKNSEDVGIKPQQEFKGYAIQYNIELGNVEKNLEKVKNYLKLVDKKSLVLLPELFSSGFIEDRDKLIEAGKKTLEFIKEYLQPLSKENSLTIVGTFVYSEDKNIFNRAFIVDNGILIFNRDKYYLFKLTDEDKTYTRGVKNFGAVNTSKGKLGIMICYELRFPDIASEFFKQKIDILLIPAEWGRKRKEHLKCLSKARAIEQRAFTITANATGTTGDIEMAGASGIYSPWGDELAYIDEEEGLISADIDLREVEKVERYFRGRD